MNSENLKRKRVRRTRAAIENGLTDALERLIVRNGFGRVTLCGLAKEAKVEPPVVYKRYKDVDDLLEKYARKYDYWLRDIIEKLEEDLPKESFKTLLVELINALFGDELMQRVLSWELSDTMPNITRKLAKSRELQAEKLIEYCRNGLDSQEIAFNPSAALLISGVFYLAMHRKVSTFCSVDFGTREGKKLLINTVSVLVDKIYTEKDASDEAKRIAKKLLENKVDKNIIVNSTGLSLQEVESL